MINTVIIGDRELKLRASALTSLLYKKLFNEDLLKVVSTISETADIDKLIGLAYVMNLQAENKNALGDIMNGTVTQMTYYEWLDGFEYSDLLDKDVFATITGTWIKNQQTTTNPKNLNRPQ